MSHGKRDGRRLQAERLESRIVPSSQSVLPAGSFPAHFSSLYPAALNHPDPDVRAAIARITTTAPADVLFTSVDPTPQDLATQEDLGALLVESTDVIGLKKFRDDERFLGIDGTGFSVVVLDTGIDLSHPFFGSDADSNGVADRIVYSADFVGDQTNAQDVIGHGTHVSSIIVSQDSTHRGMAPGANIIHLRVLNSLGVGTAASIESALQWVVANAATYNVVSVNMSLGTATNFASPNSRPEMGFSDEISALAVQNVMVIAAAGNAYLGFQGEAGVAYPAADPNAIAISATWDAAQGGPFAWSSGAIDFTTGPDRIASFSQRHPTMTTVFAPGAAIMAAALGGGVQARSGTSMSAPHVAGITALMQQLAVETMGRRLTLGEFKNLLRTTGVPIFDGDDENDNVPNTNQEYRRVDVMALGSAITSGGLSDLSVPSGIKVGTPNVPAGGLARLNFTVANQGLTSAGPFSTGFYLSTDAKIESSDARIFFTQDTFGAGQALFRSEYTLEIPASIAPGNYFLGIVADDENTTAEGNELNNVSVVPLTVTTSRSEIWMVGGPTGGILVDGSAVINFGNVDQGGNNGVRSFVIHNDGSETLHLGPIIVPNGYTVTGFPTSVPKHSFVEFTISLRANQPLGTYAGGAVFGANDPDENPFNFNLVGKVVEPDDFGNNIASATSIAMPAVVNGVILPSGEVDWFRLSVAGGVMHHFQVTLGTLGDSVLRVYGPDGLTLLATDDDSGPGLGSALSWLAPATGTYYLEVSRKGSTSGSYQLSLDPVDDFGDAAPGATAVADPTHLPAAIETPGDSDWFSFVATAGIKYQIDAALKSLPGSLVRILDADGNTQVAGIAEEGNIGSLITWTAPKSGTFYIAVQASSPNLLGNYELVLIGEDDHGDAASQATTLTTSVAVGKIEAAGDADWFSVNLLAGAHYRISRTLGSLADARIRIFAADGTTELANNDGGSAIIDWTAPAGGKFFVEVTGRAGSTGTYTVEVALVDTHGNTPAAATLTTDPSDSAGVIETAGDVDWFKFQAIAGVAYRFVATPGPLPSAALRLVGVNGTTELAKVTGQPAAPAVIEWTAPADGAYYLEVSSAVAGQVGGYRLSITGDDDHGDEPANATPLTISNLVQGDIERPGDADWYAVATVPGLVYRLELGLDTLPGAEIRLLKSDGVTLVTSVATNGATSAIIEWTADSPIHLIEVKEQAAGSVGPTDEDPEPALLGGVYHVTSFLLSALPGDYDGDVDVDGHDFIAWQRSLGLGEQSAGTPFNSLGFEGYAPGPLETQFEWQKQGAAGGLAEIQSTIARASQQAVKVTRGAVAASRWGVSLANALANEDLVLVRWDMLVNSANAGAGATGPFFGVEARDEQGTTGLLGSFGVNATTLDLVYQRQDDGALVNAGKKIAANVWHSFALLFDFDRNEYTMYLDGHPLATTGFVDRGALHTALDQLSRADIATHAIGIDAASANLTGTAYFDNFRILTDVTGHYMAADGNEDGVVNRLDLDVWRGNQGMSLGGAEQTAGASVTATDPTSRVSLAAVEDHLVGREFSSRPGYRPSLRHAIDASTAVRDEALLELESSALAWRGGAGSAVFHAGTARADDAPGPTGDCAAWDAALANLF